MTTDVQAVEERPATSRPNRWPLVLIGGLGVLVAIALAVAAVALRRPATTYPAGSPQRAVQRYLHLLQVGKVDAAYDMTDLTGYPFVSRSDFHQQWDNWGRSSHRVTLVRTTREGTTASVTVDDSSFSAGPFGADEQSSRVTFTLARERGGWKITGPSYAFMP